MPNNLFTIWFSVNQKARSFWCKIFMKNYFLNDLAFCFKSCDAENASFTCPFPTFQLCWASRTPILRGSGSDWCWRFPHCWRDCRRHCQSSSPGSGPYCEIVAGRARPCPACLWRHRHQVTFQEGVTLTRKVWSSRHVTVAWLKVELVAVEGYHCQDSREHKVWHSPALTGWSCSRWLGSLAAIFQTELVGVLRCWWLPAVEAGT